MRCESGAAPVRQPAAHEDGEDPEEHCDQEEMQHYRRANRERQLGVWRRRRFARKDVWRTVPKPKEPTKAEREAHAIAHIPPENLREFCVRPRCVASPPQGGASRPAQRRGSHDQYGLVLHGST